MVNRRPSVDTPAKRKGQYMKDGHYIEDNTEVWVQDGVYHQEDGPAIIYQNGVKEWYQNGLKHREDGPAAIFPNGPKYWYQNGKKHRIGGPAAIIRNGSKEYWLNNKHYPNIKNNVQWRIELQKMKRKKEK